MLDYLSLALAGRSPENDPAAVAAALDPLRNLIRSEGAAAVLLHHLAKNARSSYRGSTAIGAAVELDFKLSRSDGRPPSARTGADSTASSAARPEPAAAAVHLHAERGRVFVDRAEPLGRG